MSEGDHLDGLHIEVEQDVPFLLLCRVVRGYGSIWLCRTGPVVVPIDREAAKWITTTLSMLGFTSTTKDG